jgi:hypothetical protein
VLQSSDFIQLAHKIVLFREDAERTSVADLSSNSQGTSMPDVI